MLIASKQGSSQELGSRLSPTSGEESILVSGHPKLKHQRTVVEHNSSSSKILNVPTSGRQQHNADLPEEDPAFQQNRHIVVNDLS